MCDVHRLTVFVSLLTKSIVIIIIHIMRTTRLLRGVKTPRTTRNNTNTNDALSESSSLPSSSSTSSVVACFFSSLGKGLPRETEFASNRSQRQYLNDVEREALRERKEWLERETREEERRAVAARDMEKEMRMRDKQKEEKELSRMLTSLVVGAVSATAYALHYG